MPERKQVLIAEGLFSIPSGAGEKPHLIGSKCDSCGEVMFTRRKLCENCQSEKVREVALSRKGKLWAFTRLEYPSLPPYKAPDPYVPLITGFVELPEKLVVLSLLTECDFDKLKIGMDMEMVVEKAYENDEGDDVLIYKFRPIRG